MSHKFVVHWLVKSEFELRILYLKNLNLIIRLLDNKKDKAKFGGL
jgi:hypothetical protein